MQDGDISSMDFPAMFGKTCAHPPEELIRGLGPGPLPSNVIEANNTYIAVYETEAAIQNIRPDFARLGTTPSIYCGGHGTRKGI